MKFCGQCAQYKPEQGGWKKPPDNAKLNGRPRWMCADCAEHMRKVYRGEVERRHVKR